MGEFQSFVQVAAVVAGKSFNRNQTGEIVNSGELTGLMASTSIV
jgi:hypothetical protein